MIVSFFSNVYASEPVAHSFTDWSEFGSFLRDESATPAPRSAKERTLCLSPAVYDDGAKRSKLNVNRWEWFAADIDNKTGNAAGASIDDIADKLRSIAFIIYTTTSSKDGADCYRLMFPLSRPIDADEFEAVWQAVAADFGCFDQQTKDPSRLFIAPRRWEGADNRFLASLGGFPFDVDLAVLTSPPALTAAPRRSLARQFLDTSNLKAVTPDLLSLNGDFVKSEALAKATSGTRGGRMFGFLVSVGTRALLKGYDIGVSDLANIGGQLAATMGRHKDDIWHDAESALAYAQSSYAEVKASQFQRLNPNRWTKP